MQGNISIWRLVPLGPREAGRNRKPISKWYKRAGIAEEEKQKDRAEEMVSFNSKKKIKEIHGPLLFGAQSKKI